MRSSRPRDQPSKPKPLAVLKLSGSSFLDTIIRDDKNKDPLYICETTGETTTIYRLDHPRDEAVKAATIQWPVHPVRTRGKSGRSVQIGNGSWREAEDLLKCGPLGNTAIRKFTIPHYPNSLKWKLIPGNCFCCVTSAIKNPVAVLDAATLSAPPRIKIYDTLIERETARSQDNYKGIPTILLDYLIVTSFLLVTDVQEWLDRPREARIPGSSSYTIQRWLALIHHRPAPPEPDHPTVDLSLTVPSTPPHSATFPSPGGIWETQSGVTALSGSTGSGSGASYLGEPFTPTTPATPPTPATSAHSSAFFSRSAEDAPPVPPVPGTSSSGSPFAYNVESLHLRERPKSNPQALSHSPHSSTSTTQAVTNHSPSTSSVRPGRRQLPTPPGPAPANSFAQPWLYHSNPSSSAATPPATAPSAPFPTTSPTTPASASTNASARAARASMRGSLRTAVIPPPPPPPQHSIPLPPKLAQEQQGYAAGVSQRPRTAPELNNASRRRYSAGEFGEYEASSSVHPYAAAAHTMSGIERDEMVGRMQSLRVSAQPGPSTVSGHFRAPTQSAPDYDAHSFVNMPPPVPPLPPLPVPPGTSGSSGMRSPPPGRRVLQVVNADASSMPVEDPGRRLPQRDPRLQVVQQLPPRVSYAESVYEMPPPAYDAIDFSVPPVPPSNSVQLPSLQAPVEAGVEGHEGS
ncbi:hypothetical protein L226DRAFT_457721 [Lentinus tigrinus ALCF2SS1-7]|uniref:Uncharacterized protein n=1 Tax=Lentinus tigrinus ALCF2SS1-6 TaxID=1328759 RepID=A0A5C2S1V3_9APHY|nr:hypothetical protein L227DRAFT_506637 [Lentinus tigrinus ALCF2SS1-6]RPD78715.1 hypothetical protein L226DRAFT_457721 [Lentinus tigrinus ALCF2SS1-7]